MSRDPEDRMSGAELREEAAHAVHCGCNNPACTWPDGQDDDR